MVHGSDISARPAAPEVRSPEESSDQENSSSIQEVEEPALPSTNESLVSSTPLGSPQGRGVVKPETTPIKSDKSLDKSGLADEITNQLTESLVRDSVEAVSLIADRKTPALPKTPPPTMPNPPLPKTPPPTMPKPSRKKSDTNILDTDRPDLSSAAQTEQKTDVQTDKQAEVKTDIQTDKQTDGVMKSLLDEAIMDMVMIRRKKANQTTSSEEKMVNGLLDHADDSEDEQTSGGKLVDNDSGLSLDPFHRPGSPVPSDLASASSQDVSLPCSHRLLVTQYLTHSLTCLYYIAY